MRAAALLGGLLLAACGSPPAAPPPLAAAERPAGVVLELAVDDVGAAIAPLRDVLGEHAALAPTSAPAVIAGMTSLPRGLESALVDGPLRVAWLEVPGGARPVALCRAELAAASLEEAGPLPGSHWVEHGAALTVEIDGARWCAVGEERADVERLAPYLFTSARTTPAPVLRAEVLGRGPVLGREALDDWLDARERDARLSISAERARHEAPPSLGDPEAALEQLASIGHHAAALFPDVTSVRLELTSSPAGPELTASVVVAPGSPLAERLEGLPEGDLAALVGAMPSASVLTLALGARQEDRRSRSAELTATFAALGGARLGPTETEGLSALAAAWDAHRGELAAYSIASERGQLLFSFVSPAHGLSAPSELPVPWGEDRPFASAWALTALGCAPLSTPLVLTAGAAEIAPCPERTYGVHFGPAGVAAALGPGAGHAERLARALGEPPPAEPDRARLLARHGGDRLALLVLSPAAILPLARTAMGGPPSEIAGAPAVAISIARAADGPEIRLTGEPSALATLLAWITA